MQRQPIDSRFVFIDGLPFVMSETHVPEKTDGDNWIKVKHLFDPERPIARRPGDPLGSISAARRLFIQYEQIVAEQTAMIDRTRDAWEAENAAS